VTKGYRHGTDRLVPPSETLQRLGPLLPAMGITRVANVTGLDHIGVPVVMACRPNSRSLAVAQGKGLTLDAAKVSAVMEATESYHAERITLPLVLGSYDELRDSHPLVDAWRLYAGLSGPFARDRPLLWIQGRDLACDQPVWVPYDVVHTDFTVGARLSRSMFDTTSNGLASGNHLLEATSHAICEAIERDATALWQQLPQQERRATRVDLDTVDDAGCREILDRLAAARVAVAVWETTSDVGVPAFNCQIAEDPDRAVMPLYAAEGHGCHPRREIALLRALSEAVQSRLTFIAGSRDDMFRSEYERARDRRALEQGWAVITATRGERRFREAPTFEYETFDEDVALELARLRAAGLDQVVVVDLTRPDIGIPVVRAVVPGLECYTSAERYRPGARALARRAARERRP
jgi:YcaO-like protein with predicted kinase domain